MEQFNSNDSLYKIITKYPNIKEIMRDLGFKDVVKPGMLQSVGRIMTIKKGCMMKSIDYETVKQTFLENGFKIMEEK